ncbi:MAG: hypothetical protein KI790_01685 [Cyclobacteriaceae bacterium]|nr:hypothetical protein [Cyclobacteriaceae bacterium HetDA_MAG_MS6]
MRSILSIFMVLLLLAGCDDVIEENITNKEVFLLAPGNGAVLDSGTVSFWWDFVNGASQYELVLVSPSFDSIKFLVADSVLQDNRLSLNVLPGRYEWGVSAFNNGYATDYFYSSFTISGIIEKVDISNESITILAPADSAISDTSQVSFWWEEVVGADEYRLSVVQPSFDAATMVLADTIFLTNRLSLQLPDGHFEWRVRAQNDQFVTAYFTRELVVSTEDKILTDDHVILKSPTDSVQWVSTSVVLSWEELEGADSYEVLIQSPSFDNAEQIIEDEEVSDNRLQVSLDSGTYQWGVRAINSVSKTDYSIRTIFVRP